MFLKSYVIVIESQLIIIIIIIIIQIFTRPTMSTLKAKSQAPKQKNVIIKVLLKKHCLANRTLFFVFNCTFSYKIHRGVAV